MALNVKWYKSQNHPTGQTGLVGGTINTGAEIAGALDEVFPQGASRFLGKPVYEQFRKVFARNEGATPITEAVAFFEDLEIADQLKFAFEKTPGDTGADCSAMPSGYNTGDFQNVVGLINGVATPNGGTIAALTGEVGFWLWERIQNGLNAETGVYASLAIAGLS